MKKGNTKGKRIMELNLKFGGKDSGVCDGRSEISRKKGSIPLGEIQCLSRQKPHGMGGGGNGVTWGKGVQKGGKKIKPSPKRKREGQGQTGRGTKGQRVMELQGEGAI